MRFTLALRAKVAQLPISRWKSQVIQDSVTTGTRSSGEAFTTVKVPPQISSKLEKQFRREVKMVLAGKMIAKDGEQPAVEETEAEKSIGDTSREANPLGSQIYFYNHFKSKRVIYSLYQNLYNAKAMKQVTFMGKKTVPAALRKDMWSSFLTASFTNPSTGLKTFQHLRELRKLHETQWDVELLKKPRRERSRLLQDQRANSIADLAALCKRDVKGDEKVRLRWTNIYDAEYAAEWPSCVVHDVESDSTRYTARRMGKFEPDGTENALQVAGPAGDVSALPAPTSIGAAATA
ncbi:hypothetical protein ABW19_dt0208739 [Dactylella cylindrospora]|nr:hypothetical protein ABW19_dt0208739 [Dactylella cylindrospora]